MLDRRALSQLLLLGLTFLPVSGAAAGQDYAIYVSPEGDDSAPGTASQPFRTLARAQREVRLHNRDGNVAVVLRGGIYRLDAPLIFDAMDGGQGSFTVTWRAAPGEKPMLSGGVPVTGWKLYDEHGNIYVADVPKGMVARDLYVDGMVADRTRIELRFDDVEFTPLGIRIKAEDKKFITRISDPAGLEFEFTGLFTDKMAPVTRIEGDTLVLAQPAWMNIYVNYDNPISRYSDVHSHMYILNALALFNRNTDWGKDDNQWYLDSAAGKLYFRPNENYDPNKMSVVLPRLEVLASISGTLDRPVRNLSFAGLQFSHTTWKAPSGPEGYPSHQAGAYAAGPANIATPFGGGCATGCPAFETKREHLRLILAAIQVSAAQNIRFTGNTFTALGSVALGIGNDAQGTLSGVGLGASDIYVQNNRFAQLSGGALLIGGVQPDAHHPSDVRMTNRNIVVSDNYISAVAKEYRDNAAVLSTYVDGFHAVHNEIWDAPFCAISIGWGWGINDAGGSDDVAARITTYRFNKRYDTPTTYRNNLVANNRINSVSNYFQDGGAIYNLSASPGTVIRENYLTSIGAGSAIYLDQGSRYIKIVDNVVDTPGIYLMVNTRSTVAFAPPFNQRRWPDGRFLNFRSIENEAIGNWHSSSILRGDWIPAVKNIIRDDSLVPDKAWPKAARDVIRRAGVRAKAARP